MPPPRTCETGPAAQEHIFPKILWRHLQRDLNGGKELMRQTGGGDVRKEAACAEPLRVGAGQWHTGLKPAVHQGAVVPEGRGRVLSTADSR